MKYLKIRYHACVSFSVALLCLNFCGCSGTQSSKISVQNETQIAAPIIPALQLPAERIKMDFRSIISIAPIQDSRNSPMLGTFRGEERTTTSNLLSSTELVFRNLVRRRGFTIEADAPAVIKIKLHDWKFIGNGAHAQLEIEILSPSGAQTFSKIFEAIESDDGIRPGEELLGSAMGNVLNEIAADSEFWQLLASF